MRFYSKTINLYKQFGFVYILKTIIKRIISPFVKVSSFYIVAIESHKSSPLSKSVLLIRQETKDGFFDKNLTYTEVFNRQLNSFLDDGAIAVVVVMDKEVAGWGFVQNKGVYKFANYIYKIPLGISILKNLYIVPKFRGQSIGKIINQARLNIIEDNYTPLGFVIPSNKYAIRNLEMYGFVKQLYVKDYLWFNTLHSRKLKRLKENNIVLTIEKGFKNELY